LSVSVFGRLLVLGLALALLKAEAFRLREEHGKRGDECQEHDYEKNAEGDGGRLRNLFLLGLFRDGLHISEISAVQRLRLPRCAVDYAVDFPEILERFELSL